MSARRLTIPHPPRFPAAIRRATARIAAATLLASLAGTATAGQGHYGPLPLKPKDARLIEKSREIGELLIADGYALPEGPEVDLVRRVGEATMAEPADDYVEFKFGVVRNGIPNAFAMPDGQIYVHTGLLALLENEAQLAAVLAHEAMHVEGHHSILNARQARKKQGGLLALSITLGAAFGGYGSQASSLLGVVFLKSIIGYGRDLEEEADRRAVDRVLAAGYDPREMPRVFELLDEDPEGDRQPVKPAWSNHPMNVARAAYTREMLAEMAPRIEEEERQRGGLRIGAEDFREIVRWSLQDSVRQFIDADRPRTAVVLGRKYVGEWPDRADAHALLGDAFRALGARTTEPLEEELSRKAKKQAARERAKATPEERAEARRASTEGRARMQENGERAESSYLEALRLDPSHAEAQRGLGMLREREGRLHEAGRHFARYLRTAPDALDRPVIVQRLAAITEQLKERTREASP